MEDRLRVGVVRMGLGCAAVLAGAGWAQAQPVALPPDYGYTWATVGAAGNAPYAGNEYGLNRGRGSVGYTYRMATTEVTVGNFLEFYNTFAPRSRELYLIFRQGLRLGATAYGDVDYYGPGDRLVLNPSIPNASRVPVMGVSWRLGALYCNWLHHDKSGDWQTIQTGAYDVGTFGYTSNLRFTDQRTRSPGARYWIPSLDEWLKAVYYDPAKDGTGGWWNQPNGTNTPLIYGPPGQGESSVGTFDPDIPTGSYPHVTTPWGLLDASGGVEEWTEEVVSDDFFSNDPVCRAFVGSNTWSNPVYDSWRLDEIGFQTFASNNRPSSTQGLRLASAVPAPGGVVVFVAVVFPLSLRRRRL